MSSVIVVSSLYNLMQAIQIRNTILKDESVDLVLCSSQDKIEQIYNNGYLEHVFCNVYLLKKTHYYMSYNRIEKIISFISPAYELKRMLNTRIIPRWNKVYMWNPVGFTYFYYRYNKIRHLSCHYYLYADSAGGYEKSKVDINSPYHSKVLYYLDKIIYGYYNDCIHFEACLMFSPNYYYGNQDIPLIEIPTINNNEKRIMKEVFKIMDVSNPPKLLYLDVPYDDYDTDSVYKSTKNTVKGLVERYGKNNIGLRPHPRTNTSIYEDWGVRIYTDSNPFELVCCDYQESVFITSGSASAFMPHIIFGAKNTIIYCSWIGGNSDNELGIHNFLEKINYGSKLCILAKDEDQMYEECDSLVLEKLDK